MTRRDQNKWCEFHKDHGHLTDECRQLKAEIEKLIQRGQLNEYVDRKDTKYTPASRTNDKYPADTLKRIATLAGGPGGGGDSSNQRKMYAGRSIYQIQTPPNLIPEHISFTDADLVGVELPHDDPLVISPTIGEYVVDRMLIDTGSSADVLFARTFDQLGRGRKEIKPLHTSLVGFTGHQVIPLGTCTINLTIGIHPRQVTIPVLFTIVDLDDHSYNGLIGRTTLNALRAIVSPMHLMVKFPTPGGIGVVRGDQKRARICYSQSARHLSMNIPPAQKVRDNKRTRESHHKDEVMALGERRADKKVEKKDMEENPNQVTPNEELERVAFVEGRKEKMFRIGTRLSASHRIEVIKLIRNYQDVFAWSPEDMPGVDPAIIVHKLHVDPLHKPVKQKKRNFNDAKSAAIRIEVEKLLKAGAIRSLQFPQWIANVVLVMKSSGEWRMCTDFTSLNKACPKDWFPLPCLNRLVDGSAGYEVFDFLDAFRGYHQVKMDTEDQEKTTFITEYGLYCWVVMPFGLKNDGAT